MPTGLGSRPTFSCSHPRSSRYTSVRLVAPQLERRERTNRDVVSVRIPERELLCASIGVHVRLLFEPGDESACPFQGHIEIVDAKEQQEPVARCRLVPAHQRRMLVRAPLVEAEKESSIRIEELTKVSMARSCLGLAKERLVPFEASRHVAHADDRPRAFHDISPVEPNSQHHPRTRQATNLRTQI